MGKFHKALLVKKHRINIREGCSCFKSQKKLIWIQSVLVACTFWGGLSNSAEWQVGKGQDSWRPNHGDQPGSVRQQASTQTGGFGGGPLPAASQASDILAVRLPSPMPGLNIHPFTFSTQYRAGNGDESTYAVGNMQCQCPIYVIFSFISTSCQNSKSVSIVQTNTTSLSSWKTVSNFTMSNDSQKPFKSVRKNQFLKIGQTKLDRREAPVYQNIWVFIYKAFKKGKGG